MNIETEFDLTIIIPVFNNMNFTKTAVKDLLRLPKNYEILVVDNASTDDTQIVLHEFLNNRNPDGASLAFIACPRNLGFGRANNKGYKHARGRNILFLNNDIKVKSDFYNWPEEMVKLCDENCLIATQGGLLDGQFNFVRETFELLDEEYYYLSGWCLAGSKKTFDKLILNHFSDDKTDEIKEGRAWGPWNEHFFAYFEDPDLTWRAKELGIDLKLIKVPIHHFGRMTGKNLNISKLYTSSREIFKKLWAHRMK